MSKLTLAILFVVLSGSQALAGPPTSKTLRATFEAAQARHRSEMKAIDLEAKLMSELTRKDTAREAVADAKKPQAKKDGVIAQQ